MSRKAGAASAVELIRRGFAPRTSHEFGTFPHQLPFFRSNSHNLGRNDRRGSPKPRVDFSRVNDVDDAICLFREMLRMRPQPSIRVYTTLLSTIVKMQQYSVALSVFDEMRRKSAPVDEYTFNIANQLLLPSESGRLWAFYPGNYIQERL
ncbi:hypothetical protein ACS0TY_025692 [Phlomoides rotata]